MHIAKMKEATIIKGAPESGVHAVKDNKGDWVMVLFTTGEKINRIEKLARTDHKVDGWYWARENTPAEFIGPFTNSIEAATNCVHTLQGNNKFVFEKDASKNVKKVPVVTDFVVNTGIHSIQRKNGEAVIVWVFNSNEATESDLPDGFYWSAEYAQNKATGPFPSATDALLDAVRVIQDLKDGETVTLDIEVFACAPEGVTYH